MSHEPGTPGDPAPGGDTVHGFQAAAVAELASRDPTAQDRAFIALQNALRPHGGLSRLHSLAARGRLRSEGQERNVEELLDAGALFAFQWHGARWLPMFQFDRKVTTVAPDPQRVAAELGGDLDGWTLASWFVQPNARLASRSPIECMASHLPDVLAAARADRLVAND